MDSDELKLEIDEQKYTPLFNTVENSTITLKSETNDIKFEMVASDNIPLERTFKVEDTSKLDPNVAEMDSKEGIFYGTNLTVVEQVWEGNDQQIEERHLSGIKMESNELMLDIDEQKYTPMCNTVENNTLALKLETNDIEFETVTSDNNILLERTIKVEDTNSTSKLDPYVVEMNSKEVMFYGTNLIFVEEVFEGNDQQIEERVLRGMEMRHTQHVYRVDCDGLDKKLSKNTQVDDMRTHTVEKLYKCEVCDKNFSDKISLSIHTRTHTGEKSHKCEVCSKSFTEKVSLTMHMRMHTGGKPYVCGVCNKSFSNKGVLIDHMKTHSCKKLCKCEICNKRKHTVKLPYECNVCKSRYIRKYDLIRHLRTHIVEKACECEVCSKSFNQGGHLTGQM